MLYWPHLSCHSDVILYNNTVSRLKSRIPLLPPTTPFESSSQYSRDCDVPHHSNDRSIFTSILLLFPFLFPFFFFSSLEDIKLSGVQINIDETLGR